MKRKHVTSSVRQKNQNFGGAPQSKQRSATIKIHDPNLTANKA